jgi:small subunit ribosomal protein S6
MRSYELGVIIHPDVEQADVAETVEKISEYVKSTGGEVTSVNVWGRRKLAYPIQKQSEGSYAFLQVSLEAKAVDQVERNLKLDEQVIRHMFVRLEE